MEKIAFAKALKNRGHEVEVLTGFPNYPGGKLYPGYWVKLWQREALDGIRVNRVALYPSHDRSGFKRMANYLSFGASVALLGPFLVQKPASAVFRKTRAVLPMRWLICMKCRRIN